MRWTLALCLLLAGCSGGGTMTATQPVPPTQPTPEPEPQPPPVPPAPFTPVTVIVIGSSAVGTLSEEPGNCCTNVLAPMRQAGFAIEAIDAPCHGQDFTCNRAGFPGGLEGWARAVAAGVDIFSPFCERLRQQINDRPVFVAGISRGGYAALRCDLGAPVKGIITYAPVTDLYRLTEFAGTPFVPGHELMPQRIPTLIRIGRNDTRVGTDAAVAYANMSGAELHLLDTPGHTAPELGDGIEWIRAHR